MPAGGLTRSESPPSKLGSIPNIHRWGNQPCRMAKVVTVRSLSGVSDLCGVRHVGMVTDRGEIHSLPLVPLPRGLRRTSGFTKCIELRDRPDGVTALPSGHCPLGALTLSAAPRTTVSCD